MTTQDDAIQSDVSTEDKTTEAKTPEPSARELAMDALALQRQVEFDKESGEKSIDGPNENGDKAEDQIQKQLEPEDLDKKLVKVKIDGVESEVSIEEMKRQYQKNGAAERRLEEATRLLQEARQAQPVRLDTPQPSGETVPTPKGGEDEEGKAFLAALFEGDETKALEALKKFGMGRQQPTLDANQLAAQITPAIKQQLVVDSALEKFKVDYADIVADPYLADLADRYLDAETKAGKPFAQALDTAGKATRDWLSSKGIKTPEPSPTIDRNTKLERKASIDKIPALSTKATTIEEPEQSATDVINEMRKARGLLV